MATLDFSARPIGWPVRLLGWICILLGLVLLAGGVWLIVLGGSWYYGIAGLGLAATSILLNNGSMAAVWLYLAIWLGTLVWAWWEVGADWWAQLPRVFAPTLLLVLVLICIPALSRRPAATRSRREPRA
jgi:quinoprotein glucose dehydrogenase